MKQMNNKSAKHARSNKEPQKKIDIENNNGEKIDDKRKIKTDSKSSINSKRNMKKNVNSSTKRQSQDEFIKNRENQIISGSKLRISDSVDSLDNLSENYNTTSNNGKRPKKKHKVLKVLISLLLVAIITFGFILGRYVHKSGGSFSNAIMNMVKDVLGDQDPIFVLVMGVSEDISVELTDTIILVGYNPDTNQAFMLSIPRDTFVGNNEAYAGGYDKINALYQTSPQKTVEAVEGLTGVNIDYYVTVKTSALVEIVDIIGGVEFDVPIDMDYDDSSQDLYIHLKAGRQRLNGDQAEQLVRFRHNNNGSSYSSEYGDNDIGRMKTQREFIKVVANQLLQTSDTEKLKEVARAVFSNLSTDMELSKVLTYIPYVAQFDVENNLAMDQLPGTPAMLNELWFFKANTKETQELIDSYIERLGLTDAEKAKYIKPITKKSNGTTTQTKTTNNNSQSQTNTVTDVVTNTTNANNTAGNDVEITTNVIIDYRPTPGGDEPDKNNEGENGGDNGENPQNENGGGNEDENGENTGGSGSETGGGTIGEETGGNTSGETGGNTSGETGGNTSGETGGGTSTEPTTSTDSPGSNDE